MRLGSFPKVMTLATSSLLRSALCANSRLRASKVWEVYGFYSYDKK